MNQTILFGEREISGEALRRNAAKVASGLVALGIGQGGRIAVMLRNEPAYLELLLAADRVGAHCVAVNWHFRQDEARFILEDSDAVALVVHADLLPQLAGAIPATMPVIVVSTPPEIRAAYGIPEEIGGVPAGMAEWAAWRDVQPEWTAPPVPPLGVMMYTSGTTGRPKGVRRLPGTPEQHDALRRVRSMVGRTRPGMRTAILGPLYHAGPGSAARLALQQAELIAVLPRFDPEGLLRLIEARRLTHLTMVPVMFVRLLKLPDEVRRRYDLSSLECVSHGGSACAPEVKREMIAWWGPILNETYGSTEASLISFVTSEEWLARPGTVGRPLPGTSVRILDEEGKVLPPGEVGEIYVNSGPNALPFTYHKAKEERRRIERDGHVTNGDVGYVDDEGYLFITDRKRDMVVSGGVNIYPAEIEAVLIGHPAVLDCAVLGVPDPEYGEALVAAVQPRPGAAPATDELRAWLRERLAGYKVPRRLVFVAEMPRDSMGKVFKRRLREHFLATPA